MLSPSAMKISPFLAMTRSATPLNASVRLVLADDPFPAERHQQLALGAELEDLVIAAVGDPDVPVAIGSQEMRRLEHPLAPGPEEFSVLVERHDRHRLVAMENVDVAVALVDVDARRGAPGGDPGWKRCPVLDNLIAALGALRSCGTGKRSDNRDDGKHAKNHEFLSVSPPQRRSGAEFLFLEKVSLRFSVFAVRT